MEKVILELVNFSHIWRSFCEAHNVKFTKTVEIELTDETTDVCCFKHRVWWVQKLSLKLSLQEEVRKNAIFGALHN